MGSSKINYSYRKCSLSGTQQEGLISLLLKQGPDGKYKDPVYLKKGSLQCCDAKILAKCIALRIKMVLPGIVHPDQTDFLHGRYI